MTHRRGGGVRAGESADLRLALFLGAALTLAAVETLRPARVRTLQRRDRWPSALLFAVLAGALGKLAPPAGLAGAARWAERRQVGLFPTIGAPPWARWLFTLVVLDLAVWAQHVLSHTLPGFWRLHRVHHTDPDLDVTTGVRFHPVEIVLSALWKTAVVVALGAPARAVLAFEVWLSTGALFTHANLSLPRSVDRVLRRVIVTPTAHRFHHRHGEAQSRVNYGFGLSAWDRLFDLYGAGEVGETERLGVAGDLRSARDQRPTALLLQPFHG